MASGIGTRISIRQLAQRTQQRLPERHYLFKFLAQTALAGVKFSLQRCHESLAIVYVVEFALLGKRAFFFEFMEFPHSRLFIKVALGRFERLSPLSALELAWRQKEGGQQQ